MTSVSRIAALRALGRDAEASKLIVAALRRAAGSKRLAAAELGVNAATLYRQIAELGLWSTLDALAESKGWRRRAGRARGPVTSAMLLAFCVLSAACGLNDQTSDRYVPFAAGGPSVMDAAGSTSVEHDAGAKAPEQVDAGATQPAAAGTGGKAAGVAGSTQATAAAGTAAPDVDTDAGVSTPVAGSDAAGSDAAGSGGSGGSAAGSGSAGSGASGSGGSVAGADGSAGAAGSASPQPPTCWCDVIIFGYGSCYVGGVARQVGDACVKGDACKTVGTQWGVCAR